jgi:hypothetical protein
MKSLSASKILSYLLHPLLVPFAATVVLMNYRGLTSILIHPALRLWYLGIVASFTFVVPLIGIFIMLKTKAISSLEMPLRIDRSFALLITTLSYIALLILINTTGMPAVYTYILYTATFAMAAGFIVNLVFRLSLHTLGWGALCATLVSIGVQTGIPMLLLIAGSIIIAGFAGYARLKQNAHNASQVYLGYATGILVVTIISFLG